MNEAQFAFLGLYAIYIAIILFFHDTLLMKPFRLLTTFLHEMSHAIACWITCGDVRAIRVFDNEGGVTSYVGGCRLLIIPAGYVGAAIWGSIFVMLSGGQKTATVAAGMLVGMLLFSLCFAPNRTMVILNLCVAIFTSIFIFLEWRVFSPILNFVVLFMVPSLEYMRYLTHIQIQYEEQYCGVMHMPVMSSARVVCPDVWVCSGRY